MCVCVCVFFGGGGALRVKANLVSFTYIGFGHFLFFFW